MKSVVVIVLLFATTVLHLCCNASAAVVDDNALLEISSRLQSLDTNGAYDQLELNLQSKTSSGSRVDKAPLLLFKNGVPKAILARPTYAKLLSLFDNYVLSVNETEQVTTQEKAEETAFLDTLYETDVMKAAHRFLVDKGLSVSNTVSFKDQLRSIWFGLYQRSPGKQGSSGFEHVFLGELKNGISGLHSWVRYATEEAKGNVNFLGYSRVVPTQGPVVGLIELPMVFNGVYKAHSTMMIGSSPELEIAMYSICFLARPDSTCPCSWNMSNNKVARFKIQTFVSKFHGKQFVGSAFPTL